MSAAHLRGPHFLDGIESSALSDVTSTPEVVARRVIGLNAWPILMVVFGGFIALAGGQQGAFAGGLIIMASVRDLWRLGETVTFSTTRVHRFLPGVGRLTWWLDGNASLLYVDGVREAGRWGLAVIREGLGLVCPAWNGDVFDVPAEYDRLKLLPGLYSNGPQWARVLLTAIGEGRVDATAEAEAYLHRLAEPG